MKEYIRSVNSPEIVQQAMINRVYEKKGGFARSENLIS